MKTTKEMLEKMDKIKENIQHMKAQALLQVESKCITVVIKANRNYK